MLPLFGAEIDPFQLILVGLGGLLTGAVLLRMSRKQGDRLRKDPYQEHQTWVEQFQAGPLGKLHQLEVRFHDYGREVEARIDNKLRLMEQLLAEVAQERARLEAILAEIRQKQHIPEQDHPIQNRPEPPQIHPRAA